MTEIISIQATPETRYPSADRPTMYFIGVTTAKSSMMKIFPRWMDYLKIPEARLQGVDCKLHDDPQTYRRIVEFIKQDPLTRGGLVTTHKLDLFSASANLFDELGPYAKMLGEVSGIAKRGQKLVGYAKDTQTSGLALGAIIPPAYWQNTGAEALLLGAGGAATALVLYLIQPQHGSNRPAKISITDRNPARLRELETLCREVECNIPIVYQPAPSVAENDQLLSKLPAHSIVINATGLGKDAPGSPLSSAALFPQNGIAWDFNYRGDLLFLNQARAQAKEKNLQIEDGWIYFLHGWQGVIAEVFETPIPASGPIFDDLSAIAASARG